MRNWAINILKYMFWISQKLYLLVFIRWCWLWGVAGSAAGSRGWEHAAEEGGQDLRPDGQEPRRPPDPGGVPGGQQGGSEDRAGAEPGGRRPRARRVGVRVDCELGVCADVFAKSDTDFYRLEFPRYPLVKAICKVQKSEILKSYTIFGTVLVTFSNLIFISQNKTDTLIYVCKISSYGSYLDHIEFISHQYMNEILRVILQK